MRAGVGEVHSSEEPRNERGAKGPQFQGNVTSGKRAEIGESLPPQIKLWELQETLHAKAKGNPSYRFYALYGKVYRADVLAEAWRGEPSQWTPSILLARCVKSRQLMATRGKRRRGWCANVYGMIQRFYRPSTEGSPTTEKACGQDAECKFCAALRRARELELFDPLPELCSPLTPGVQLVKL